MKDFEILVPAETTVAEIKNRFIDFKKYGFLNIKDHKIKVVLAACKENDIDFLKKDWPENIEVEVFETPYKHVAQRIYDYYANYAEPNTANWYVRVDEDSITDINGLHKSLELAFDPDRDYHIGGDFNDDIQGIERKLIEALGFGWWLRSGKLEHEHEISITSRSAMEKILKGDKSKKYFELRRQFEEGYGDHGLCFAARMNKIYHTSVRFLTRDPEIRNFSMFGGHLNHIHWVDREKTGNILKWMDLYSQQENSIDEDLIQFTSKTLFLTKKNDQNGDFIKLLNNNLIETIHKPEWEKNIGLWTYTNNKEIHILLHHNNYQNFKKIGDKLESKDFLISQV